MSYEKFDHGPLQEYAITWNDGTIEVVKAHQVMMPEHGFLLPGREPDPNWTFHGEIEGHWRLILSAPGHRIEAVRLLQPAKEES